jgi:hypothetical protein
MANRMKGMAKVSQAQTYCLFESEPVVWGLTNDVCDNFEEAYVTCLELLRGHECKMQSLIRKLDVLRIVVCQESLKRFPGGEVRYQLESICERKGPSAVQDGFIHGSQYREYAV